MHFLLSLKVVVKKMLNVHSEDIVANLKHEAALLNHFGHHPNIVSFVGACTDPNSPLCVVSRYLYPSFARCGQSEWLNPGLQVTEYVEGGSVEDAVYQSKHRAGGRDELDLRARTRILRDASCGIVNIHEGNVLHRDIAARLEKLFLSFTLTLAIVWPCYWGFASAKHSRSLTSWNFFIGTAS